jgi:organic radical activating enzyme
MSEEEFSLILEKLKNHTEFIYYHLMGEPLTHPLLPTFLKMAKESGYKSIITTNGTLIESRGEELILLPALPKLWKNGRVSGLRVNGKTLDMEWKDGKVIQSSIY